ncbi:MAG: hypothetical protein M3M89_05105, partial [Thermoproteota archaeon]|nr:hypothetical protein [Thermoproteota archaeon]
MVRSRRILLKRLSLSSTPYQLAVERFADSVEEIAIAIAENAGMDPLDTQTLLRAKAALAKPKYGVDVINGKVADMAAKD